MSYKRIPHIFFLIAIAILLAFCQTYQQVWIDAGSYVTVNGDSVSSMSLTATDKDAMVVFQKVGTGKTTPPNGLMGTLPFKLSYPIVKLESIASTGTTGSSPIVKVPSDNVYYTIWAERGTKLSGSAPDLTRLMVSQRQNGPWSKPEILVNLGNHGNAATLLATFRVADDASGRICVVYSATAGQDTLIYELQSTGGNWSPAKQLFPGVRPDIGIDPNGNPLIVFVRHYPEGDSLYFSRFENNGATWIHPVRIKSPERGVINRTKLLAAPDGTIHVLWEEHGIHSPANQIFHTYSADDGASWSRPDTVSLYLNGSIRDFRAVVDHSGNVYAMISENNTGGGQLKELSENVWKTNRKTWWPATPYAVQMAEEFAFTINRDRNTLILAWISPKTGSNSLLIRYAYEDLRGIPVGPRPNPPPPGVMPF